MKKIFPILLTFLVIFSESCISNKKHAAFVNSLKETHEQTVNNMTLKYNRELAQANDTIRNMSLRLAERKGENNILVMIRKELRDSINFLNSNIRGLSQQSSSTQQNLAGTIAQKESEIKRLQDRIAAVDQAIDQHVQKIGTLSGDIRYVLQDLDYKQYNITTSQNDVSVSLNDDLIFYKGSNSRMNDAGILKLEQLATVFNRYPAMRIQVTGHTDNLAPRRKADVDNWNVSVVRAASVVRTLTRDFDVSPNQVTAAGKGEYSPLTSNADADGRDQNSRIEFRLAPRERDLVKSIRAITQ